MSTIPNNLRKLRKEKGITAQEMAEKLQCTVFHYYKMENGKRNLPVYRAVLAADILGVTLNEIFLD
jgi:transcriptional regulator with XRE-family HTH domain